MTTAATNLERNDESFAAYTEGTSAHLSGLAMYDCPYPARTLKADCWELGFGRASHIVKNLASCACCEERASLQHYLDIGYNYCPFCGRKLK